MTTIHELSAQLQAERRAAKLTLAEVATRAGMASSAGRGKLWSYENGRVYPRLDNFLAWAAGVGFDVTLTPRPGAQDPTGPTNAGPP